MSLSVEFVRKGINAVEDETLPFSVKRNAQRIARNVRRFGEKKFGPMWAKGYAVLPDGRTVFLQQSQQQDKADNELLLDISDSSRIFYKVNLRYELGRDKINRYRMLGPEDKPITAYWEYDYPDLGTRVPANLKFKDILEPVGTILEAVEKASKSISWTKPEV